MKKILTVLLMIIIVTCTVFAGDFKFLFTELDQHMELLGGFLPTLITVGESYEGLELLEGNLTQIQATLGGGLSSKSVYLNPDTGEPLVTAKGTTHDILMFDDWQIRWNLKMLQGFGDSWVEGKDLVTAYVGYEGRWEKYIDYILCDDVSIPKAKTTEDSYRKLGSANKTKAKRISEWLADFDANNVYPDLSYDDNFFTNFYFGGVLNTFMDDNYNMKGAKAELKFQFAPGFNKTASYYSITANAVGGYTLYRLAQSNGMNLFSVSLKDRLNVNWTDGEKVPVYASSPVSLGRKVRGFNTNSYGTNFTVVNNFDVRLAGPEAYMNELFPRINLFFDMGVHAGKYFNTNVTGSNFLCSTGFEAEMCFWGICDIGIQYSYLLSGTNLRDPKNNLIMGATFFLDF